MAPLPAPAATAASSWPGACSLIKQPHQAYAGVHPGIVVGRMHFMDLLPYPWASPPTSGRPGAPASSSTPPACTRRRNGKAPSISTNSPPRLADGRVGREWDYARLGHPRK
jgi:hypothetical protein